MTAGERHLVAATAAGELLDLDRRPEKVRWAAGYADGMTLAKALDLIWGDLMLDAGVAEALQETASMVDSVIYDMPRAEVLKMYPAARLVFRG